MKILGYLLMAVSVSTGALAAANAYHVSLSLPDEYFKTGKDGNEDLTIKSPAGVVVLDKADRTERQNGIALEPTKIKDPLNRRALERLSKEQRKEITIDEATGLVLLDRAPIPLAGKDDKLTPDLLKHLREQAKSDDPRIRQQYVIVKEFSVARWSGEWMFLASVAGLVAGALVVRFSDKKAIRDSQTNDAREGPEAALESIERILGDLRKEVGSLHGYAALEALRDRMDETENQHVEGIREAHAILAAQLPDEQFSDAQITAKQSPEQREQNAIRADLDEGEIAKMTSIINARSTRNQSLQESELLALDDIVLTSMEKEVRMRTIIARLDEAQRSHMPSFIDARPLLIGRMGLGGYAAVMDRYAACERQINRAWSAAADGVYAEAVECLDNAAELVMETREKLR